MLVLVEIKYGLWHCLKQSFKFKLKETEPISAIKRKLSSNLTKLETLADINRSRVVQIKTFQEELKEPQASEVDVKWTVAGGHSEHG